MLFLKSIISFRHLCAALLFVGFDPVLAAAQPEGQLVIATEQDPNTLNPVLFRGGTDYDALWPVFDALVETGTDGLPRPLLADSWEVGERGLTYTFHLKEGILWQDGEPLTADDVAFTFYRHLDPAVNSTFRPQLRNLVGFDALTNADNPASIGDLEQKPIEVVSPTVVKFHLSEPNAGFLDALTMPRGGIVPKHLLEGQDINIASFNIKPVGSGPFKVVDWRRGDRIVLEANESYHLGAPSLKRVIFRIVPEPVVQLSMMNAGDVGFTRSVPFDAIPSLEADERFEVMKVLETGFRGVLFNLNKPQWQDIRVRQTVAHAIDRDAIVEQIGQGAMVPSTGPITPASWAHNSQVKAFDFDPEEAKRLLTEAGWTIGSDGKATKDNKPFTVNMIVENFEALPSVAVALQENLRQIGIEVSIEVMDFGAWLDRLRQGNYDLSMVAFGGSPDPDSIINLTFHSQGGRNLNGYRNPELDALVESARQTSDKDKRRESYNKIQMMLADDLPAVFLYHPRRVYILDNKYTGWEPVPASMGMYQSLRNVQQSDE